MMRLRRKGVWCMRLGKHLRVRLKDDANEWFRELYDLFAPVREQLAEDSEKTIDRRIARAVRDVRARK